MFERLVLCAPPPPPQTFRSCVDARVQVDLGEWLEKRGEDVPARFQRREADFDVLFGAVAPPVQAAPAEGNDEKAQDGGN